MKAQWVILILPLFENRFKHQLLVHHIMKRKHVLQASMALATGLALIPTLTSCTWQMSESVMDKTAGFNGNFEVVKNNLPVNWLVYTAKTAKEGNFTITPDAMVVKSGTQSLKFTVQTCSAKGGRFSPGISQEMPAQADKSYRISYWIKNEGAAIRVNITGVTAHKFREGTTQSIAPSTSDWKQYTYTYILPAGMQRVRFEMNVLKPGTCWIDDVQIVEVK